MIINNLYFEIVLLFRFGVILYSAHACRMASTDGRHEQSTRFGVSSFGVLVTLICTRHILYTRPPAY